MKERLSAVTDDVNRICGKVTAEFSQSGKVAWPQVICKYGADHHGVNRTWQKPTDLIGKCGEVPSDEEAG